MLLGSMGRETNTLTAQWGLAVGPVVRVAMEVCPGCCSVLCKPSMAFPGCVAAKIEMKFSLS